LFFRRALLTFLLLGIALAQPAPKQITVAAASDMSFALKDIAAKYEKKSGLQVRLIFGSSGNLYQQIRSGLPIDLFLSADEEYPAKLAKDNVGLKDSLRRYATGTLALWVPRSSKLDVERLKETALLGPNVNHIAMPNPKHAPYGRAAQAALRSLKMWDSLQAKLVIGENVSQTAQFIQSGNAEIGFIPLSLALSEQLKEGRFWKVPQSLHPPIQQALIVIQRKDSDPFIARAFADYLFSGEARETLKAYGFELPDTKAERKTR
jgi:molybdate transport system substrate-binding protein